MKRAALVLTVLLMLAAAGRTAAQPTAEAPASILVFPHVVVEDSVYDTVIHISNSSNLTAHAHCFYVNAIDGCEIVDFNITLFPRQPTHWVVSSGRAFDPLDPQCSPELSLCDGAGHDVPVLPVGSSFTGQLLCVQVASDGFPLAANSLQGSARRKALGSSDVARYNAIGLRGEAQDFDQNLCLGGGASVACPGGAEYDGCPSAWILNHVADGAQDAFLGDGSDIATRLTLVPCSWDLEMGVPATASVSFSVTNEFETTLLASTTVDCWEDLRLSDISTNFTAGTLGSFFARTRITTPEGAGVFVISEEIRTTPAPDPASASSFANPHVEGEKLEGDVIVLPPPP